MTRRWLAPPRPPSDSGEHEGRPYTLWLPELTDQAPPWPGMVVVHGAGSTKENHADFARLCAESGWAAVAYDQRGHGESADEMGPEAIADAGRMARMLAAVDGVDPDRVCVRGSSLGGYVAIHAAAVSAALAGAIAVCPAWEENLLRGLREGDLEMRCGPQARADLEAFLGEHDIREAAAMLAPKPLLILHARGDERIAWTQSEELGARAGEPKRTLIVPGGHHRSLQHDHELQAYGLRWIGRRLG